MARATFVAQGVSAILAYRDSGQTSGRHLKHRRDRELVHRCFAGDRIAAIAVLSIMQQSVLSVGNMFVQEIVNRYGSAVIAGWIRGQVAKTIPLPSFHSMSLGGCLSRAIRPRTWEQERGRGYLGLRPASGCPFMPQSRSSAVFCV